MAKRRKPRRGKYPDNSKGMTKTELSVAQLALDASRSASRLADALDPKRDGGTPGRVLARKLDSLARTASDLFWHAAGRLACDVSMVEINTEDPAEWTQRPFFERADGE